MSGRLVTFIFLLCATPSLGWDKHQFLTRAALANEPALDRPVEVVPLEQYLQQNFGERCTWERAKDAVFDGVGREYQVFYQSHIPYSFEARWEKGTNVLTLYPERGAFEGDPQQLGGHPSAREVIVIYSDEPDWKMDDEVPRLVSSNSMAEASSGTATRALRHFWTPKEEILGVRLDTGQETDKRMQLFYELALIAFDSGHDYWGYRFLGNAVHYLEDMSQPFHTRLVISSDMLDMPVAIHRAICEVDRDLSKRYPDAGTERCEARETLSRSIIESGWYVGTYHGLFEDFGLALLEKNAFSTKQFVARDSIEFAPIRWRAPNSPWLDARGAIHQAQALTLPYADETAAEVLATFGSRYVRSRPLCELALTQMGQGVSREYQVASSYYLLDRSLMNDTEFKHRARLLSLTQSLQRAGATWARQFIRQATAARSDELTAEIKKARQRIADRCGAAPAPAAPPKRAERSPVRR